MNTATEVNELRIGSRKKPLKTGLALQVKEYQQLVIRVTEELQVLLIGSYCVLCDDCGPPGDGARPQQLGNTTL
jgi:hypothetical protein